MAFPPAVSGAKPLLGHALEFLRDPDGLIARGCDEHGTIFSVRLPGGPGVVLLGPERGRFMFGEADSRLSIKDAYPFLKHMFNKVYWLDERKEYLRQREILVPQFTGKQVAGHLDLMDRKAVEFIDNLADEGEFDLVKAFGPLIMDIASSAFLGEHVATKIDGFFEVFRRFSGGIDPIIPGWVPAAHLVRSHRAREVLRRKCKELIDDRRRDPLNEPDFPVHGRAEEEARAVRVRRRLPSLSRRAFRVPAAEGDHHQAAAAPRSRAGRHGPAAGAGTEEQVAAEPVPGALHQKRS